MKTIRRVKIRFEKHELTLVRLNQNARIFCPECRMETAQLTIAQAANVFAVSEKSIFRLTETGQIHSTETANGQFLICAASAANFKK